MFLPTLPKDRDAVRVRPFVLPRELYRKVTCSNCEAPAEGDGWVVHIDKTRNDKSELKAASHFVCSESCREELHAALTIEYGFTGVVNDQEESTDDAL